MVQEKPSIWIVHGCVGEDDNYEDWIIAAYIIKKDAQKHVELATKELERISIEDLPDETPFDPYFLRAHDVLDYYSLPTKIHKWVSYFTSELKLWTETDILKAMGQS